MIMTIMKVLPLLVRWADGVVSDEIRDNIEPLDFVLDSGKRLPVRKIIDDKVDEIEDWLWRHPEYNINRMDLFYNYWEIVFALRELGLVSLNVFYRSDKIKKFESFVGKK